MTASAALWMGWFQGTRRCFRRLDVMLPPYNCEASLASASEMAARSLVRCASSSSSARFAQAFRAMTKAELFGGLNARKGNEVSKDDLSADLEALLNTGLFANVDANVTPKGKDGYAVEFVFREKIWPGVQTFRVKGATALPAEIEKEVLTQVKKQSSCTVRTLATMKNVIEGYYTSKGLTFGTISHFDGMETGDVIAHVIEGEITRVKAVFLDDQMQPVNRGRTHPRVIQREHNFKVGQLYNVEDAKTALRDIFLLQLFDNVQVVPRPDDRDQSKVAVDIMLRERPVKTAESELEWSIAPGEGGKPDVTSGLGADDEYRRSIVSFKCW